MTNANGFGQIEELARARYDAYHGDADLYREAEYAKHHSSARLFSEWLGTLLLDWGRRLRERRGDVTVQIALEPRGRGGRHAA